MKKLGSSKNNLDYYEMFIDNANLALKIATKLNEYTDNYDFEKLPQVAADVHKYENDADKNLHDILSYLIKDFLPPIDREDIVLLSNKMDDAIDYLDEIFINLNIFNVKELRDDFKTFVVIINKMSTLLISMFTNFKNNYYEVHKLVIEINETEEAGDKVFQKAVKELFTNENNPVEIIRWNTIFNELENCVDSFENIANTVDEIILKNS